MVSLRKLSLSTFLKNAWLNKEIPFLQNDVVLVVDGDNVFTVYLCIVLYAGL